MNTDERKIENTDWHKECNFIRFSVVSRKLGQRQMCTLQHICQVVVGAKWCNEILLYVYVDINTWKST
jgi:hypothetical protein